MRTGYVFRPATAYVVPRSLEIHVDDFENNDVGDQPTGWDRYLGTAGSVQSDGGSKTLKLVSDGVGSTFYSADTVALSSFVMELKAKDANNQHFWIGRWNL